MKKPSANPFSMQAGGLFQPGGRFLCRLLAMVLLLLTIPACKAATSEKPPAAHPPAHKIHKAYEAGPLRVWVQSDKDALTPAESLQFILETHAPEGYEVQFPEVTKKIGEFKVTDCRIDGPQLTAEGLVRTRKIYILEPFLPGDYSIPSLGILFVEPAKDPQNPSARESRLIETEALTLPVRSLLGEKHGISQLHPPFGPMELPRSRAPVVYLLTGLAALAGIVGAGLRWMKKRETGEGDAAPSPLPPHEAAYRQLQELLDEGLLDRAAYKDFFARISDVIRFYVENRFGLHAPKLTTEEFLNTLHDRNPFSSDQQRLLNAFLSHCDLVKFARYDATREEALKSIEACRAFIDATRLKPEEDETKID